MPFPNEHSARLKDPKLFARKSFRRTNGGTIFGSIKVPKSIGIIWGKLKGRAKPKDPVIVQALRFKRTVWTVAEAKAWLKKKGIKYILFEPATGKSKNMDEKDFIKQLTDKISNPEFIKSITDKVREKLKSAANRRSKKYGIGLKKGGNLIPPKGYPKYDSAYGDPVNYKFLINEADNVEKSCDKFTANNKIYTRGEKSVVYNRIVNAKKKFDIKHKYSDKSDLDKLLSDELVEWAKNNSSKPKKKSVGEFESQEEFTKFVGDLKKHEIPFVYDPDENYFEGLPEELKKWSQTCREVKKYNKDDKNNFLASFQVNLVKEATDGGKTEYFLVGEASNMKIDRQNDKISPEFMKKMVKQAKGLPLLLDHWASIDNAIGVIKQAEEIDEKMIIKARIEPPLDKKTGEGNADVKKIIEKRELGIPIGLSIGGRIFAAEDFYDDQAKKKYRLLLDGELYEISATVLPAIRGSKPINISQN